MVWRGMEPANLQRDAFSVFTKAAAKCVNGSVTRYDTDAPTRHSTRNKRAKVSRVQKVEMKRLGLTFA